MQQAHLDRRARDVDAKDDQLDAGRAGQERLALSFHAPILGARARVPEEVQGSARGAASSLLALASAPRCVHPPGPMPTTPARLEDDPELVPAEAGGDGVPLALDGVRKHWKGNSAPVVAGVDLRVEPGTVTWIGGRNGAGKTTLLRIAAGLIRPDAGTVRAFGADPLTNRRRFHSRVGFLTAGSTGLYARLSVRHQLEFQAGICLLERQDRDAAVERELNRFELRELASRRVERMSMGQRQRLRLALTLLHGPQLLLLDEPRTSLDDEGTALLQAAVDTVLARGGAAVWCSPPHEGAEVRADRHLILDRGSLGRA